MLTVLTQTLAFPGIVCLADAENTIDQWEPFSSLAVPGLSAARPVRRSPHLVGSQSRSTISPEATAILRWIRPSLGKEESENGNSRGFG
jgi:hypothetical protein